MSVGTPFPEVLSAAQVGAPWAFEVIYRELTPSVTGYLRLHGALEPDDLASETFIGVFTGLSSFSGTEEDLRAWCSPSPPPPGRRLAAPQPPTECGKEVLQGLAGGDVEEDALARMDSVPCTRSAPRCPSISGQCSFCASSPASPSSRSPR